MPQHIGSDGAAHECWLDKFGECRWCQLIDVGGPHYSEKYRKYFFPGEFPETVAAPQVVTPSPAPAAPGLLQKAASFGKAIVTHAIAGLPTVDDATHEARLEICRACPSLGEGMTCLQCGCALNVKTRWAEQRCPIGRW